MTAVEAWVVIVAGAAVTFVLRTGVLVSGIGDVLANKDDPKRPVVLLRRGLRLVPAAALAALAAPPLLAPVDTAPRTAVLGVAVATVLAALLWRPPVIAIVVGVLAAWLLGVELV